MASGLSAREGKPGQRLDNSLDVDVASHSTLSLSSLIPLVSLIGTLILTRPLPVPARPRCVSASRLSC